MNHPDPAELIARLELSRHPEGGWFRETYRSPELLPASALPERFGGSRALCTAIYFLLERGDFSALHRIKSDEIWHYHGGSTLLIHVISPEGDYHTERLGVQLSRGDRFQTVVPAGSWFGAEPTGDGPDFALVSCTVAPGFDYADFIMADRAKLCAIYPQHAELICRMTRGGATK